MQLDNPGPLKNPLHIALSKQRKATSSLGGHLDTIAAGLSAINETLAGFGQKPTPVVLDDGQVEKMAQASAGAAVPDKAMALAVILFERTGDVVTTTLVGKWFESVAIRFVGETKDRKIKGKSLLTIGDLVLVAENYDHARAFAVMLDQADPPVALIEEMEAADFYDFLRLLPTLALRLDQAAPPAAAPDPGTDPD
ncbi:MAG: hypothetical protein ACKOPG_14025 [Novosphingobium sp.]